VTAAVREFDRRVEPGLALVAEGVESLHPFLYAVESDPDAVLAEVRVYPL